jgi:hypothetical protein
MRQPFHVLPKKGPEAGRDGSILHDRRSP